ncbi:DNA/RNA non-specific endonuclease [bacterium]|nr:DNA/RNA non-specific endonuclease [bacterium]
MKKNQIFLILLCVLVLVALYFYLQQGKIATTPDSQPSTETNEIWSSYTLPSNLELPATDPSLAIINHKYYSLGYNELYEQAAWVAYSICLSELQNPVKRKDHFMADPSVSTGSATLDDYKRSGYDRGHLAPAADMAWSKTAMDESFYMSNMSPQEPSFNRGIWKKLEEQVRTWVYTDTLLFVVTGPVFTENMKHIGGNEVAVPNYYYKIVADFSWPEIKTIAFVMPNEGSKESIYNYVVSIDSVEQLTGLDFFYQLPDALEDAAEAQNNWQQWAVNSAR